MYRYDSIIIDFAQTSRKLCFLSPEQFSFTSVIINLYLTDSCKENEMANKNWFTVEWNGLQNIFLSFTISNLVLK